MIKLKVICLALILGISSTSAIAATAYDSFTDARAKAAANALQYSLQQYQGETDVLEMYTSTKLNNYIEQNQHLYVIDKQDGCQFMPDIEDRARIVGMPVFQYAFADMLLNGVCVKQDVALGLDYLQRSIKQGYAPALVRMSFYYEHGKYVGKDLNKSETYMRAAASLGSLNGRLGWADMLVRGYGNPSMYEQAYSWLHHTYFDDEYRREKSSYIMTQLRSRMPENVVVRAVAYDHSL